MGVDLFADDFDAHEHFFKGVGEDFFKLEGGPDKLVLKTNNDVTNLNRKEHARARPWFGTMELIIPIASVVCVIILIILLCKCCQRRKYRGQVINPPPPPGTTVTVAAPYPQQQYIPPVMPSIPVGQSPYPVAPYPTGVYPHPAHPAPAHYPPAVYPHPQPQPQPQPPPTLAPSAPDANAFFGMAPPGWNSQALPPSYEQATGAEFKHSSPYNPNY